MDTLSRRSALCLLGTAGVAGASAAAGPGFVPPALAAKARKRRTVLRRLGPKVVINSGSTLIGMSAPAAVWSARARAVGPGLGARRIFADLAKGPTSQIRLIEQAHADGLLPVVSYKVGGDAAGAAAGKYNAVAEKAAARLASYGLNTAVTFWHEPYGDIKGNAYAAASQELLPIFKQGRLKVGPILNGWLLDNKVSEFASYCPDELFELWDWFGIDTYQSGSKASPGGRRPAGRVKALSKYLKSRGYGKLPIGVGEYNGFTAQAIAEMGEVLFATPNLWFGCLWNSTGGRGLKLTGKRLNAFQKTLEDPRRARILKAS